MRLATAAFIAVLGLAHVALAQEGQAVVVVDQDRLFQDSLLGQSIADELEDRSSELAAENRAIEAELIAEESELTERRPELEPQEFRALADAFDEKVERLRAEQDAKGRELVALRDDERQRFTRTVGPILLDFMRQSGAAVMLDRRSVVASADRADVTDDLIALIDEVVGVGEAPTDPPAPGSDAADPTEPAAHGGQGEGDPAE